jgi:DNA repair exonuclease SbcCD ATPase subunit
MHIKISGFKIHLEADLIFENDKMTLLRATSGAGKSTILQAIFWAMYGNMRGIYNANRVTKNLSVTLSLPGMTIVRKKNPEFLSVSLNNKLYEDTVAQGIIDNTYGHRELWRACSYIEQKQRCALLSGTAAERMELLNALSFTGENPKEYINKIGLVLKEKVNEFERLQSVFVSELNTYTEMLKVRTIRFRYTDDDILRIRENVLMLEDEVKRKHEILLECERLTGTINYLVGSGAEIRSKIGKLKSVLNMKRTPEIKLRNVEKPKLLAFEEEEITIPSELKVEIKRVIDIELEKEIISYSAYTKEKDRLVAELKKLEYEISSKNKLEKDILNVDQDMGSCVFQEIDFPRKIKEEEIWNVKKLEIEIEKYKAECKGIGLEYNEVTVRNAIAKLTDQLKSFNLFESQLDNYNRLLGLEKRIEELASVKYSFGNTSSLSDIEHLAREKSLLIVDMKKGLELLSCPKCSAPLRYVNGSLSLGERDPVSKSEIARVETEYLSLIKNIEKYRELMKYEENYDFIVKSLDKEGMKDYIANSRSKVSALSALIHRISQIKFLEIKESSEFLSQVYKNQMMKEKFEKLKEKREGMLKNLNEISPNSDKISELKNLSDILERKYREEQERILKVQELVRKYQAEEMGRLKMLSEFDRRIREREERKRKLEMENKRNLEKYEEDIKRLERELKEHEEQVKKEKEEYRRGENELNNLLIREKDIGNEIENIKSKIDSNAKGEYEECVKRVKEEKEKGEEAIYTVKCLAIGKDLESKREILMSLQNDVETLNGLKAVAVQVECRQLEDTVNNINTVLENTLQIFFNDPISLVLKLYKTVKDNVKPGLNLEICYKGCKYDSVNHLSGGEGDRVSLALVLALNSVSCSNIVLLDESTSSLDGDLKEGCITGIKSIPGKTVIVVDHDDGMEGFYDAIIDL